MNSVFESKQNMLYSADNFGFQDFEVSNLINYLSTESERLLKKELMQLETERVLDLKPEAAPILYR